MAMVGVVSGSLQADSQPGSFGLVWGSAAAWRRAIFIIWTGWTLAVALSYDDSTINIVVGIIILLLLLLPKCLQVTYTYVNLQLFLWSERLKVELDRSTYKLLRTKICTHSLFKQKKPDQSSISEYDSPQFGLPKRTWNCRTWRQV